MIRGTIPAVMAAAVVAFWVAGAFAQSSDYNEGFMSYEMYREQQVQSQLEMQRRQLDTQRQQLDIQRQDLELRRQQLDLQRRQLDMEIERRRSESPQRDKEGEQAAQPSR